MDNTEIDKLIKESLSNSALKITPQDSFAYIQSKIKNSNSNKTHTFSGFNFGFNFRRAVAGVICTIFIVGGLSFAFSEDVRAATFDAINKIKTIFVVDKVDGEYKVVEKSAEDAKEPYFSAGASTVLSETEIESMVGFKIHFSETLGDYKLVDRGLGLILQKGISYETFQKLQSNMSAAIDDENEFKKLNQYKPVRDVEGAYKNKDGTIVISANNGKAWQSDLMSKSNNIKAVKIGDMDGKWVELPLPIYPMKEDGTGGFDLSQKPTEIKIMHALIWNANYINYMLTSYDKNSELSLDNMLKVARAFMTNLNSSKDYKSVVLYEVQADTFTDTSMNKMITALKARFQAFGFKDVLINRDGAKNIKVFLTGDQELSSISEIAGNKNELKFSGPDGSVFLTGKDIKGSAPSNDVLLIQFTNEGKDKLFKATTELIGKPLKVFLDDKLLVAPIVRSPIADGRVILTGLDGSEEIKRVSTIFNSRCTLEYPLKVVSIEPVQ